MRMPSWALSLSSIRALTPRRIRALLWLTGLLALLGATLGWALPARPYEAPWAWISFIGMCIVDDFVLGSPAEATWGELPKVALFAAIIVFRRHPEITLLVAITAAPLGSALKGQSLSTGLTATAQWLLAAVVGAAAFRLVGFEDTGHFVAATVVLLVIYYALGHVLSAWLRSRFTPTSFQAAFAPQHLVVVWLELVGVLLAFAWRTASLQPAALKVADAALVAVAGIVIGALVGQRATWLFRLNTAIPIRPVVVAGVLLLVSLATPSPLSWLLPLALAMVASVWAIRWKVYPIACGALGTICNELVRAFNGGYMPVDGAKLLAGLGRAADTYVLAGPQTRLAWLDDRFALPPPFPGIASAGDILIAIGMAWLVATVMVRRQRRDRRAGPADLATPMAEIPGVEGAA
ncbi:MAG TPA: DUF5317 family protein [Candidatus Angelobacter sp.]|nr:DUF5317 family protein [Candidatus Angelobacter sp.]